MLKWDVAGGSDGRLNNGSCLKRPGMGVENDGSGVLRCVLRKLRMVGGGGVGSRNAWIELFTS